MEDDKKRGSNRTRLSMNTSLKNANIFDDEAWMEMEGKQIKIEPMDSSMEEGEIKENLQTEKTRRRKKGATSPRTKIMTQSIAIKQETIVKTKQEKVDDDEDITMSSFSTELKMIKQEREEGEIADTENEDNFIDQTTVQEEKMEISRSKKTPIKKEIIVKKEINTEEKIINGLDRFGLLTPVKSEEDETKANGKLQTAKRTIFTRNSPFKKEQDTKHFVKTIVTRRSPLKKELDSTEKSKVAVFNRLGPKLPKKRVNSDSDRSTKNGDEAEHKTIRGRLGAVPPKKKRTKELETDPEVLARRQKQVDYGKNTLGYGLYRKTVPKSERTLQCPRTPDKFQKYSRRAWDGLIRQWRVQLHKYDPDETNGEGSETPDDK